MELSRKKFEWIQSLLGGNMTSCDVTFFRNGVHILRCVFLGAPDPELIAEYKFTDEDLNAMERESVPLYILDIIRRTRNVFYNEEAGLYGVALDWNKLPHEIKEEERSVNLASQLAAAELTELAQLGKLAENVKKLLRTAGINDDGESVT